ncbi:hypothetical protein OO013_15690 [Mangrovivirga sp. M17]|uniref:Uncharacterized protein n=1 Tax=Mangrovivirga halotolerans TaxID=2993936 RepID=A0ABT3RUL0_9BACT|nr:hypothetical protein [Mangrovivirga halotolerans]MCX2745320.1 hypothetical protein [Mangrovivirga halotolerans]
MKSSIIKGITLLMFSSLIISFVAYKSGYLGGLKSTYQVSPNGSALNNQTGTVPGDDSLKRIEMMSSSKVLILRDHTIQTNDTNAVQTDSTKKINPLIYSSKSGIILKPEDYKKLKKDSILIDTLIRK